MFLKLEKFGMNFVAGYDKSLFWRLKQKCRDSRNILLKAYYLRRYNKEGVKYGAYVGYNAHFEDIPMFPHGLFGIFISDHAVIGKNCVIFHHVTIGSNTLKGSITYGAPIIGKNCYIGAGAKIIGSVRIGNNVRIGANCVVTKDISDNHTVVLSTPRLIDRKNINNTFIRVKHGEL